MIWSEEHCLGICLWFWEPYISMNWSGNVFISKSRSEYRRFWNNNCRTTDGRTKDVVPLVLYSSKFPFIFLSGNNFQSKLELMGKKKLCLHFPSQVNTMSDSIRQIALPIPTNVIHSSSFQPTILDHQSVCFSSTFPRI